MLQKLENIEYIKKDLPYCHFIDQEFAKIGEFPLLQD